MKKYFIITILFVLLCNNNFFWAQQEKPIQISVLIGDTLDLVERDYYALFPTIEGFQYAVYTQYEDSLVKVKVYYLAETKIKDTTNIIGMQSLENISERVNKIDRDYKPNEMGKKISIKKLNGETIEGELLYVRPNSIIIIPLYELSYNLEEYIDLIEVYKFSELNSITIIYESNLSASCLRIGGLTLLGAIAGGLVGQASSSKGFKSLGAASGAGIFLVAGLVGGILLEIFATADEEFEMEDVFDYRILRPYSRFNRFEPEYLRKIK